MYRYETHLHTYPVSRCAKAGVRETLDFYKSLDYDGVFLTNHFLDGNINLDRDLSFEKQMEFYLSDYEEALAYGKEIGLRVFFAPEISYAGTDFLIYGFLPQWYLDHPEILEMDKRSELEFLMAEGATVIHAHPYREADYIDHIRLYPRSVHGVEVLNTCRTDLENQMAEAYATAYGLLRFAGSDNHFGSGMKRLAGMCSETPIRDERDFAERVLKSQMQLFTLERDEETWTFNLY
ncbi:MAG: histidinol-phosphatase [Oscillospiraceae bacterium]|nr:histidinol-phosphatase [Oscillospiraceae bacterium]